MTTASPKPDALIAKAAQEHLGPLGFCRKGRSRLWFADHGVWLTIVEFQPGSARGSYLNVGAMWLWFERAHFAFDDHRRLGPFVPFSDAVQFSQEADRLARTAANEAGRLRSRFSSMPHIARALKKEAVNSSLWGRYHAGVAAGLAGDLAAAQRFLEAAAGSAAEYAWQSEVKRVAAMLLSELPDRRGFAQALGGLVEKSRRHLGLDADAPGTFRGPIASLGEQFG